VKWMLRDHPLICGKGKFTVIYKASRQRLRAARSRAHLYSGLSIWARKDSVYLACACGAAVCVIVHMSVPSVCGG